MVVAHRDSGEFQRTDQQVDLQRRPGATSSGPAWYSMIREFDLAPGGYQARLVVRDAATRRVGSLAFELEVPPLDRLRVSTPILTDTLQQPPGQAVPVPVLLARRTLAAGGPLYCRFDVYGMAKDGTRGMPRVRSGHDAAVSRHRPRPRLGPVIGPARRRPLCPETGPSTRTRARSSPGRGRGLAPPAVPPPSFPTRRPRPSRFRCPVADHLPR